MAFYIHSFTFDACNKFKNQNLNFLKDKTPPDYIFSTNYTDSVFHLQREWFANNRGLSKDIKAFNIHGSIFYENKNIPNIEINLEKKNELKYFKYLKKYRNIHVEIFGLCIKNDEMILINLIWLSTKDCIITINYYYKLEYDKKVFIDTLLLKFNYIPYNEEFEIQNIKLKEYIHNEYICDIEYFNYNNKNEIKESTIYINFINAEEHLFFKKLNNENN